MMTEDVPNVEPMVNIGVQYPQTDSGQKKIGANAAGFFGLAALATQGAHRRDLLQGLRTPLPA